MTKNDYIASVLHRAGYQLIAFIEPEAETPETLEGIASTLGNVAAELRKMRYLVPDQPIALEPAPVAAEPPKPQAPRAPDSGNGGTKVVKPTPPPVRPPSSAGVDLASLQAQLESLGK